MVTDNDTYAARVQLGTLSGRPDTTPTAGRYRGAYQNNTAYNARDVVTNGGNHYSSKTGFTSAGSFSATNWNQYTPIGLLI